MRAALRSAGFAFRDVWQELWTILIVHLIFLFGNLLIVTGPPVTVALFFYGNRITHGESANERDFLNAVRQYWKPAWRWGWMNLFALAVLIGDYYLTGRLSGNPNTTHFVQGFYVTLLGIWVLLQIFSLPFLFEQEQPSVIQALRNATVFIRRNLILALTLTLVLALSLMIGTLAFMLTFVFGGAFVAFASNHAILEDLPI